MTFEEISSLEPGTVIVAVEDEGRKMSFLRFHGVIAGYIETSPLDEFCVTGFYTKANILDGTTLIRRPTREDIEHELSRARLIVEVLEGVASSSCQES